MGAQAGQRRADRFEGALADPEAEPGDQSDKRHDHDQPLVVGEIAAGQHGAEICVDLILESTEPDDGVGKAGGLAARLSHIAARGLTCLERLVRGVRPVQQRLILAQDHRDVVPSGADARVRR